MVDATTGTPSEDGPAAPSNIAGVGRALRIVVSRPGLLQTGDVPACAVNGRGPTSLLARPAFARLTQLVSPLRRSETGGVRIGYRVGRDFAITAIGGPGTHARSSVSGFEPDTKHNQRICTRHYEILVASRRLWASGTADPCARS